MTRFADVAQALTEPGQPAPLFRAVEAAVQQKVGHKLFTLMVWHQKSGEAERIYTNDAKAYPVGGRKPMVNSPYGDLVFGQQKPYLGRTKADIKWAFFDHELIYSLGLGSVVNTPVRYDGKMLGMMNILHQEHYYREQDVAALAPFAALLVPAFRDWLAKT